MAPVIDLVATLVHAACMSLPSRSPREAKLAVRLAPFDRRSKGMTRRTL